MADKTSNKPSTKHFAADAQQWHLTAIGMSAVKPIMHFQVSMLRMLADGIERFADNYQKGFEETATTVKERVDKEPVA